MGSQFSDNGYITLDELDNIMTRLDTLEAYLGYGGSETAPGNFIYIDGKSVTLDQASVQVFRKKFSGETSVSIKFTTPFQSVPIVVASADTSKRDASAFVDNVTKSGCTIRVIKSGKSATAKGTKGEEWLNIIAIGTSKS